MCFTEQNHKDAFFIIEWVVMEGTLKIILLQSQVSSFVLPLITFLYTLKQLNKKKQVPWISDYMFEYLLFASWIQNLCGLLSDI